MPITSALVAAKSSIRLENWSDSFVHPEVSARGKKKTTIFLPLCRAKEKGSVSVGMSVVGAISPTASMCVSFGRVRESFARRRYRRALYFIERYSYNAEECKTGNAHNGKNRLCGG